MHWNNEIERIKSACKLLKEKAIEIGLCDETTTIDQLAPILVKYIDDLAKLGG